MSCQACLLPQPEPAIDCRDGPLPAGPDRCFPCVAAPPSLRYTSDETPMAQYLNVHDTLDARRQQALKAKGEGPRVFVVGPTGGCKARGDGGWRRHQGWGAACRLRTGRSPTFAFCCSQVLSTPLPSPTLTTRRGQEHAVPHPAQLRGAGGLGAHLCRRGHRAGLHHRARLRRRHAGCAAYGACIGCSCDALCCRVPRCGHWSSSAWRHRAWLTCPGCPPT